MMEAARSSETSVDIYLTTRQYIAEDSQLHTRRRENLKYLIRNICKMLCWKIESTLLSSEVKRHVTDFEVLVIFSV